MTGLITHIHPIISHFPIVLVLTGFIAESINKFGKSKIFLKEIGYYFQIIGAAAIILSVLTGLFFTVEQSGKAHEIGEMHEKLAYLSLVILLTSSVFSTYLRIFKVRSGKYFNISYLLYLAACLCVLVTGFIGGTLVYDYLIK